MPSVRKRALDEANDGVSDPPKESSVLQRIRNMWQFANLGQWIALFGKVVKLDENLDIADLETECLKPSSTVLQDIGLALLKFLSSHRGLTHELFDEYTRRQFLAKAPDKNPFGTDDTPLKFADFDVFTRIRTLQQMTQMIMINPERLRDKTEEQRDKDQTNWRIEAYGWDRKDRTYFALDDNRLYRLTEAPPPAPKPKRNTKKAKAAQRASKRRRVSADAEDDVDGYSGGPPDPADPAAAEPEDDGLGGMKWECLAVSLEEVRQFLATIERATDLNEKVLRNQIRDHLVPILEKQEESRKRKEQQREKELMSLEKMAHAKRSTRIAGRAEQRKAEEQMLAEERKRREEEEAARKEEQKRIKMERQRDNRLLSRVQRLQEREARRRQHQEELAQLSEDSRSLEAGAPGRLSERRIQAEMEKKQQALRELEQEEEDWMFDCICGVHGRVDDGTHSVACDRCSVWQHSKCLGIDEKAAEEDNFTFVCASCRRREQDDKDRRPRMIKIKVNRPGPPSSPPTRSSPTGDATASSPPQSAPAPLPARRLAVELPSASPPVAAEGVKEKTPNNEHNAGSPQRPDLSSASGLSSRGQPAATPSARLSLSAPSNATDSGALPPPQPPFVQGAANPFSLPHPTLSPPDQSLDRSRAYGSIFDHAASVPRASNDPAGTGTRSPLARQPTTSSESGNPAALADPLRPTTLEVGLPPTTILPPPGSPETAFPSSSPSFPYSSRPASGGLNGAGPPSTAAPQWTPGPRDRAPEERTTPLPPSRGGLSPVKHSPPPSQKKNQNNKSPDQSQGQVRQANGIGPPDGVSSLASPKPTILPPGAALSPSPPQQILTPPVKHTEPARPTLQQQQQHVRDSQGPAQPTAGSS